VAESYKTSVVRGVLVFLSVLGVVAVVYLALVGVLLLVHSHHHHGRSPVVTVGTSGG